MKKLSKILVAIFAIVPVLFCACKSTNKQKTPSTKEETCTFSVNVDESIFEDVSVEVYQLKTNENGVYEVKKGQTIKGKITAQTGAVKTLGAVVNKNYIELSKQGEFEIVVDSDTIMDVIDKYDYTSFVVELQNNLGRQTAIYVDGDYFRNDNKRYTTDPTNQYETTIRVEFPAGTTIAAKDIRNLFPGASISASTVDTTNSFVLATIRIQEGVSNTITINLDAFN